MRAQKHIDSELQDAISNWTRYVDDIEPKKVEMVEKELNSFHNTIKFTHELEQERKILFLDVLIKRKETDEIETSVIESQRILTSI